MHQDFSLFYWAAFFPPGAPETQGSSFWLFHWWPGIFFMLCSQLPTLDTWLIPRALLSASVTTRRMIFDRDNILSKTKGKQHLRGTLSTLGTAPEPSSPEMLSGRGFDTTWKEKPVWSRCRCVVTIRFSHRRQPDKWTRLDGKGPRPVLSQLPFVPFFTTAESKVLQWWNTQSQLCLEELSPSEEMHKHKTLL